VTLLLIVKTWRGTFSELPNQRRRERMEVTLRRRRERRKLSTRRLAQMRTLMQVGKTSPS
jgi:hypothetical protein